MESSSTYRELLKKKSTSKFIVSYGKGLVPYLTRDGGSGAYAYVNMSYESPGEVHNFYINIGRASTSTADVATSGSYRQRRVSASVPIPGTD